VVLRQDVHGLSLREPVNLVIPLHTAPGIKKRINKEYNERMIIPRAGYGGYHEVHRFTL
jgi:hypothetical protein